MISKGSHLILYDGPCGLCNRFIRFVLSRDPAGIFAFASLQSAVARATLLEFGQDPDTLTTFYVVQNRHSVSPTLLGKSRAALLVLKTLGRPWRWLGVAEILPAGWRDWIYDRIARNRDRFFGRSPTCAVVPAAYRSRFIDGGGA